MAARLGATFLRCAMGPLVYAGGLIMASKVPKGLAELAIDSLHGGFLRGVSEVAKQAGVAPRDVEGALPMGEVRALVARLGSSQPIGSEAWALHAGHMGGLLPGVADLTVDGRVPDIGLCLERLANKVARDRALADPLRTLAADVEAWQTLMQRCRAILDGGHDLARAYRRRRLTRWGAVGFAGVVIVVSVAVVGRTWAARSRVEAVLSAADPCAVASIAPADRARASGEQGVRIQQQRSRCDEGRAAQARVAAEAADKAARAEAEARVKAEREAACVALADAVERGAIADALGDGAGKPPLDPLAAAAAPFLERAARGALGRDDLPTTPPLPCADSPAGGRIRAVVAKALLASPTLWANADDHSDLIRALLVEHRAELPEVARQRLRTRAHEASKSALLRGDPARVAHALRLCETNAAVSPDLPVQSCEAVAKLAVR